MKKVFRRVLIAIGTAIGLVLVALAIGYVAASGEYVVAATTADDPALPQITVDGVRLHAEAFGDPAAHTVVVLHGGPGNSYKALLALKALEDDFQIVFYDQRGSGLSERLGAGQLTLDALIEELKGVIDLYSPDRPVSLIGHSWGAMLASAYIGRYPETVTRVVMAEPGFLTPETGATFVERTNGMAPDITWNNLTIIARAWFESLHVDGPDPHAAADYLIIRIVTSDDIDGHPLAGYFCQRNPRTGVLDDFRFGSFIGEALRGTALDEQGNFNLDFTAGVDRFEGDALFVTGSCNTIIGVDQQKKHMKFFKNPRLVVIDGAGHSMFGEKPDVTLPIVREFLAGGRQ